MSFLLSSTELMMHSQCLKIIKKVSLGHAHAAEVLEVHVRVGRHVGVGGLLSVGVVPDDHEIFFSMRLFLEF